MKRMATSTPSPQTTKSFLPDADENTLTYNLFGDLFLPEPTQHLSKKRLQRLQELRPHLLKLHELREQR